jgi:hypothetical protein
MMTRQATQSRSRCDTPEGRHAPSTKNGEAPFVREGGIRSAVKTGKNLENRIGATGGRCTMAEHGPAAEPGKVIWEMSD